MFKIKKKLPLVSIYIISKNYGRFLYKSINSVFNQTFNNWELFLVDDNSNDNTRKIFKNINNPKKNKISIIRNSSTEGIQKIANKILTLSSGKYFMRLDADDWLEKEAIKRMVDVLESNPKSEIVFGNYNFVSEEGTKLGTDKKLSFSKRLNYKHFPAHGACTMFRKKTLVKVGGYDEKLKAQDGWDIWQKIAKKDAIFHINKTLFNYRQHENSLSSNKEKVLKYRNMIFEGLSKLTKKKKKLNCLAIIPVKENYKNFSNVPFLKIKKKNLLDIAIDSAINSIHINKVAISTSSKKVLKYIKNKKYSLGKNKIFTVQRNNENSKRFLDIRKIIIEAGESYKKKFKKKLDLVVYLSIHAPFRKSEHIEKALNILLVNKCDTVFSVNLEYEPTFKFSNKGIQLLNPGRFDELNFERETLLKFNGSLILTKYSIIKNSNIFKSDLGYLEMNNFESQQIKSNEDLKKIKTLIN
jgi:CMP-N-acetylneuraminic acid synthetase